MLTDLDYDLLSAYIDDALTDEERADLESRLQTEPELRSELEELRATVTLLNNLPPRKAPRDFTLDARYARRTSFFASATFSALSTAAAVILFAVGAFLFTNNNQPPTSSNQAAQVALGSTAVTATSATTLDKGLVTTATLGDVTNDVAPVTAPTILEQEVEGTLADGVMMQQTATVQNEQESEAPSLFNPDTESPADAQDNGDTFNAAPASPSQSQERSTEATETLSPSLFEVQPTGAMGGAAPSEPPTAADSNDAMSSMMMATTETPTLAAMSGYAMQQPAATFAPSSTLLPPTLPPTATVVPTATDLATETPTLTATNTAQPTATSPHTSTPEPTPVPPVERERADTTSLLPLAVLVLASVFLVLGVATTIARRRSR